MNVLRNALTDRKKRGNSRKKQEVEVYLVRRRKKTDLVRSGAEN